jgi:hypothetical protein
LSSLTRQRASGSTSATTPSNSSISSFAIRFLAWPTSRALSFAKADAY